MLYLPVLKTVKLMDTFWHAGLLEKRTSVAGVPPDVDCDMEVWGILNEIAVDIRFCNVRLYSLVGVVNIVISAREMLSSSSPRTVYIELRPASCPVVPDGGVTSITTGCSVVALQVELCACINSSCTMMQRSAITRRLAILVLVLIVYTLKGVCCRSTPPGLLAEYACASAR